jgi:hypothetical protein
MSNLSNMSAHAQLYADLALVPEITSAYFSDGSVTVLCQERDIDANGTPSAN